MKLYTEEEIKRLLKEQIIFDDEDFDKLTPIELPSDEEIEQEAHTQYPVNLQPNGRTLAGGKYDVDINYSERIVFTQCAKWMRDKILQGGNK